MIAVTERPHTSAALLHVSSRVDVSHRRLGQRRDDDDVLPSTGRTLVTAAVASARDRLAAERG